MTRVARAFLMLQFCLLLGIHSGCTAPQVRRQHGLLLQEVTELQYNQTLSNIAMFKSGQGAVPHFAIIGTATTQIQNSNGFSTGLDWNPTTLTRETFSFSGNRNLSDQFGAIPVTDAARLRRIGCALDMVIQGYDLQVLEKIESTESGEKTVYEVAPTNGCVNCVRDLVAVGLLPSTNVKETKRGNFTFEKEEDARDYQMKLLDALACRVPTCWFGFGSHRDIPKEALYIGRYGKCYTWVTCGGVRPLSQFTMSLLHLAQKDPSSNTVELRRLVTLENGQMIEVKGTAQGNIGDFVLPSEFSNQPELRSNSFESVPLQPNNNLLILPQGLMVTPGN